LLPSDVELLVSQVESGVNVPDTSGSSFVGSGRDFISIWSSLSSGGDGGDLEVVVGSRVESSNDKRSGGGRDWDIDPDSCTMNSVGNVPSFVGSVSPGQGD
jgi:hypothetical protein